MSTWIHDAVSFQFPHNIFSEEYEFSSEKSDATCITDDAQFLKNKKEILPVRHMEET